MWFLRSSLILACLLAVANATKSENGSCPPIKQHPYVVSIERKNIPVGGGSIISPNLILTTSTIIKETTNLGELSVRTGSNYSNKYGIVHNVCNAVIHPNNTNGSPSPIGILRLENPIIFDETRQPIRYFFTGDEVAWRGQLIMTAWSNIFNLGSERSTELSIFKGSVKYCQGVANKNGIVCVDRLFPKSWTLDSGHGHPVTIDGLQAGLVMYSQDTRTYIGDLVPYSKWIQTRILNELGEQCPKKEQCNDH